MLDDFFKEINSYGDKVMKEHNVLEIWNEHGIDYADLGMGIEIRDCIEEHGKCSFTAEL